MELELDYNKCISRVNEVVIECRLGCDEKLFKLNSDEKILIAVRSSQVKGMNIGSCIYILTNTRVIIFDTDITNNTISWPAIEWMNYEDISSCEIVRINGMRLGFRINGITNYNRDQPESEKECYRFIAGGEAQVRDISKVFFESKVKVVNTNKHKYTEVKMAAEKEDPINESSEDPNYRSTDVQRNDSRSKPYMDDIDRRLQKDTPDGEGKEQSERKLKRLSYLLWGLGLVGFSGVQRMYLGQYVLGFLMLFTFGFCGIGQLIDLILIGEETSKYNENVGYAFNNNSGDVTRGGPTDDLDAELNATKKSFEKLKDN